jgi:PAS domain S-box-containing protein
MTLARPAHQRNANLTLRGPSRIAWLLALGYAVVLVVSYNLQTLLPTLGLFAKYIQYLPLTLGGAVALWLASRRTTLLPGTQSGMQWLALGMFGSALGMLWYIYVHEIVALPKGLPRVGDVAFLLSYLAIIIGIVKLPRRTPGQYDGWKVALDAAVVAVGFGLVGWHLIIAPTTVAVDGPVDLFIRVAYPLLDLGFLFALNSVMVGGGVAEHRPAFRWIGLAIIAYIVAESLYQVMYYGPGPAPAPVERLSEAAFTLAYLSFLGAGLRYATLEEPAGVPTPAVTSGYSPLPLIATGVVAILLTRAALDDALTIPPSLVLGLVVLSILLLVRQGLTSRQNTRLLRAQAHQEGNARIAALVRHGSDLFIVADPDGAIRFVSPSSQRILGRAPEQLVGRQVTDLVHIDDVETLDAISPPSEGAAHLSMPLRLGHAEQRWVEFDVVVTDLTKEPAVAGVIFVARDLTERNALESRLRQAQKMEAVGRLAGGVAHDFNNLLTTILASTDLLLEDELTPPVRADLEIIRQASSRASGLTGQLLAFSRQEKLQRRPIDLAALAEETVQLLRRLLGAEVHVSMSREPQPIPIEGDANQLAQVIVNLSLNARDAMPRGGTLTIRTGHRVLEAPATYHGITLAAGSYGVLEVTDTGAGMDADTLGRIFEPFFTTKAAGKGTGLGLATTLRIVAEHGGGIEVDSVPGRGTSIRILLPATGAPAEAHPVEARPATRRGPEGTETILVVEDEASVREVTARILTRLGYRVMTANGAGHARRVLADRANGTPNLMLTDVMMPGMTGPELAERVAEEFPEMQILFMSGYPGDELGRVGLRAAEVSFLQKPFTPVELAERIRAVLDDS